MAGSGGRVGSHLGSTKESGTAVAVMLVCSVVQHGVVDQSVDPGLIIDCLVIQRIRV